MGQAPWQARVPPRHFACRDAEGANRRHTRRDRRGRGALVDYALRLAAGGADRAHPQRALPGFFDGSGNQVRSQQQGLGHNDRRSRRYAGPRRSGELFSAGFFPYRTLLVNLDNFDRGIPHHRVLRFRLPLGTVPAASRHQKDVAPNPARTGNNLQCGGLRPSAGVSKSK